MSTIVHIRSAKQLVHSNCNACTNGGAHKHNGMAHFAWRTRTAEALEERAKAIEKTGRGIGWHDGDLGHVHDFY